MKSHIVINRFARLLAICSLAIGIFVIGLGGATHFLAADTQQNGSGGTGAADKIKEWQQQMSEAFHDTWKGIWEDKSGKSLNANSVASASVDLREQQDSYTVRLNLPGRDLSKIDVKMDGDSLHIVAPPEGKTSAYEQDITLSHAEQGAKPSVARNQGENLIVITVPKALDLKASPSAGPAGTPPDAWDQEVLGEMSRMQREMDRIFDDSFQAFHSTPGFQDVFDVPDFGSSIDLQDSGDKYVIRAYLPARDMDKVNVSVEGNTLKLEAEAEKSESNGKNETVVSRKSKYTQFFTLPGAVKSEKMNVERHDNVLVVTLPKAS